MEDKVNGERKKLSLSSGGKLTLKNSIATNKSSNSRPEYPLFAISNAISLCNWRI